MCKKRQCAAAEKIEKLKALPKSLHTVTRHITFAISKKETQIFYIMENYQENKFTPYEVRLIVEHLGEP